MRTPGTGRVPGTRPTSRPTTPRVSRPRAAGQFIARGLVEGDREVRRAMERHHGFACRLLDLTDPKPGSRNPLVARLSRATADQATMVSLAVLLAAFEASTSVETWRSPTAEQKRYFAALAKWGVRLHWVEQLVNDPEADAHVAVDADLTDLDPAGVEPDAEPDALARDDQAA
ncbi:hypothetical protein BN6_19550 [Saccharothrix espanaensis DSM 44229]|uniref:Uncharacterized protein n=2 Tax=Saccharothrix espanaensis TaxID=103731 RepID=K0JWW2_SACES|nr:hypothetical protein BN6_19550 [Saccharothrix espanaensis DSM 44229]